MPESKDLIALRGSTEESIKAIDDKLKEIEKNMTLKTGKEKPDAVVPPTTDKPVSKEYQKFIDAQAKFLKEKQAFDKLQRESLLESFSTEDRERYAELTIEQLKLISTDRKQRKEKLYLSDPENPPTTEKVHPTVISGGDGKYAVTFDQTDVIVGWGTTPYGVGWHDSQGRIVSTDRKTPYGVKKK